jgi:2-hydroxychromene-2-carboxylate isomerase
VAGALPIFYYDLASPFSCLAAFRVEDVLPSAPEWRPVWGAPLIAASGRDWRGSFEEGRARRADIVQRAARYGMWEWRWPPTYEPPDEEAHERWTAPNSLAVMRLATYAQQQGVGERFSRGVFRLAFEDGHDISLMDDAVVAVAAECDIAADEAMAAPNRPEIKQALRSATETAIARGVIGIPTVEVGDELFWGDDRLADAAAAADA